MADPSGSGGGEILATEDFEGALGFQMTDDALAGNGVHFEKALAFDEGNTLGDCFEAIVKLFPQLAKRFLIAFELGVETTRELENQ